MVGRCGITPTQFGDWADPPGRRSSARRPGHASSDQIILDPCRGRRRFCAASSLTQTCASVLTRTFAQVLALAGHGSMTRNHRHPLSFPTAAVPPARDTPQVAALRQWGHCLSSVSGSNTLFVSITRHRTLFEMALSGHRLCTLRGTLSTRWRRNRRTRMRRNSC